MTLPLNRAPDMEFSNLIATSSPAITYGSTRDVYDVLGYPEYVIKKAKNCNGVNANENEATIYYTAVINKNLTILNVLAGVIAISQSGDYLIMEKLRTPLPKNLRNKAHCPVDVSDIKPSSFGVDVGGNVKCLDYGTVRNKVNVKNISQQIRNANLASSDVESEMSRIRNIINGSD
ncbi:hypothetical protein AE372_004424 [Salmonella enterica subsp. enterica serovar Colindale]|nr:hypothetical protein [Salmonella enterica subsp. enterica serovar Colindale]